MLCCGINDRFAPEAAVYPKSLFSSSDNKNKRPRGHYTAWPLRDCLPRPSRDSVTGLPELVGRQFRLGAPNRSVVINDALAIERRRGRVAEEHPCSYVLSAETNDRGTGTRM
jgi:hypothetical protein